MDISQVAVDLPTVRLWAWTAGYAALWLTRTRRIGALPRPSRRGLAIAATVLLFTWVWPQGGGRVQPGDRGIVLRFGAPTGRILKEGLYYVVPLAAIGPIALVLGRSIVGVSVPFLGTYRTPRYRRPVPAGLRFLRDSSGPVPLL